MIGAPLTTPARAAAASTLAVLLALVVGHPLPASAQTKPDAAVVGDPHNGNATWLRDRPAIQAEKTGGLGPAATGAIFVPAMTDPVLEPSYVVMQDGRVIATSATGSKVFVQAGKYDVFVGSGVLSNRLEYEANVVEGRITFIPVEWTGLSINVVDDRGTPFRGSYEIVRLPEKEYVGVGLGAAISEGERLTTWLLQAGQYMILAAGESYQARKNFVTLRLPPGQLVQYTLVLDEETGDMLGAGEVFSYTGAKAKVSQGWSGSLVLGGTFDFSHSDSFVGKSDGITMGLSAFLESFFGFTFQQHGFTGRLKVEAGGDIRLEPASRPFVSDVDELTLELLYMYAVTPWFGPYARTSMDTQILPGELLFDSPTVVSKLDEQGFEFDRTSAVESFTLAEPFAPIELGFGSGLRFDFKVGAWLKVAARVGVGGRHVFTRDLFVDGGSNSKSGTHIAQQVGDVTQFGPELSLVAELNLTRWVTFKLDTDLLTPFDELDQPIIDFRGSVGLRLTSFASINYTARIKEDRKLSPDTQFDNQVLLRFAYKVL